MKLLVWLVNLFPLTLGGHSWPSGYSNTRHSWATGYGRQGRAGRGGVSPAASQSSYGAPPSTSSSRSSSAPATTYTNWADRCGDCKEEAEAPVCGSDGKTYRNSCELQYTACRIYWDIREVGSGACRSSCPGVELGMFTGWGVSRASNRGYCNYDFFRCCKAAREAGIQNSEIRSCCQGRFDECMEFVESKPWRSGVAKYGK